MNWFRAIERLLRQLVHFITWPFRALFRSRNPLQEKKPGVIRTILLPFFWVFWLVYSTIANLIELVISWSSSRQSRAILMALPSLIAFGLFSFVIVYLYNSRSGSLVNTYLLRAYKAENVESYETARMYYQKLLQLDLSNQSYEFQIARTFDNEGNLEEATRRMGKLRSQPEVAGAVNYWFAQKMLEREDLQTEQKWILCLEYLEEFLGEAPKHKEANILALEATTLLGNLYKSRGMLPSAISYFRKAEASAKTLAGISERSYLALAQIQRQIGELYGRLQNESREKIYQDAAFQSSQQAVNYFTEQLSLKENAKNLELLLLLADCYVFQKKYQAASDQIDEAMRIDSQNRLQTKLRDYKSKVYGFWAQDWQRKGPTGVAASLNKADAAIKLNPKNELALSIVAQISVANIEEVSLAAKQKLDDAIMGSDAPFSVHLILGSYAAVQNDDEKALKHLRQAQFLNPKATAVMNNLAFVLARMREPRFKEALSLVNQALKLVPNNPRFLDTRGNIYMKMGQYELAFHDLELAELKIRNNPRLYENLIFLVDRLGFEDMYRRKYQQRLANLTAGNVP